jgi:hypothetical protein
MSEAPSADSGSKSFSDMEGQGSADVPSHGEQMDGEQLTANNAGEGDRPDWLFDKYNSVEDQAKAYKDLHGRYTQKNEKFREDVKSEFGDEFLQNHFKDLGVPDAPDEYAYPENFEAPDENVDQALREWAKENNVSASAFGDLINNVWGLTQAKFEDEAAKLGADMNEVEQRVGPLNQWIANNFDESFAPVIKQVMMTAAGVEFMEGIHDAFTESGFAPESGDEMTRAKVWDRDEIRAMQADERYQKGDPAYVKKVQSAWQEFAEQQKGVR